MMDIFADLNYTGKRRNSDQKIQASNYIPEGSRARRKFAS